LGRSATGKNIYIYISHKGTEKLKGKGSHKNICIKKKEDKFQPRERMHLEIPQNDGKILFCNTS